MPIEEKLAALRSRMRALGWSAVTPLGEGLKWYYEWFLENKDGLRELKFTEAQD